MDPDYKLIRYNSGFSTAYHLFEEPASFVKFIVENKTGEVTEIERGRLLDNANAAAEFLNDVGYVVWEGARNGQP